MQRLQGEVPHEERETAPALPLPRCMRLFSPGTVREEALEVTEALGMVGLQLHERSPSKNRLTGPYQNQDSLPK